MLPLLFALFTKHLVCDFLYQPPYMWQNKGIYGHPGGVAHVLFHFIVSAFIFACFSIPFHVGIWVLLMELVLHYNIDWAKMNINRHFGWKCNTHNEFWVLTGVDQYLHALTYLLMVWRVS